LGYIDDVNEVYVNGHLVGASGTFPPLVKTAYQELRKYPLPTEILNTSGENVIAVRVYDEYMDGGIYAGPVGIYYDSDNALLTVNLSGYWDFETEKNTIKQETAMYGATTGKLFVPSNWESQGFPNYDGRATYNQQFRVTSNMDINDIFLVLGYIDDIDEVIFNGTKIGSVYNIRKKEPNTGWEYRVFRAYKLPPHLVQRNALNNITVRVLDTGGLGGIYEGPVGLTTEANLKLLQERNVQKVESFWDFFNEFFFD
jgi:sialate O-acetylesterase